MHSIHMGRDRGGGQAIPSLSIGRRRQGNRGKYDGLIPWLCVWMVVQIEEVVEDVFKNNDVQVSTTPASMLNASLPIIEMMSGHFPTPHKGGVPCPFLQMISCCISVCICCGIVGEGPAELRGPGESGDGPQSLQPVHPGQGHRPLRRGQVRKRPARALYNKASIYVGRAAACLVLFAGRLSVFACI